MACNCKKTLNKMEKYADEDVSDIQDENFLIKLIGYFLQICFGILVFCISILILPIILLWLVGCIILRKDPNINIGKMINKNEKRTT